MVTSQQILRARNQQQQIEAERSQRLSREREEAERLARQVQVTPQVSQNKQLSKEKIEQFTMYPWGDEFASLPKELQNKFQTAHQDYIAGAERRKNYIPTASEKLTYEYDALRGNLGEQAQKEFLTSLTQTSQIQQSQQELNVPAGFHNKDISNLYANYQNQLTDKQRKTLSQYEQNKIITSNQNYQNELKKITSKPEVQKKMETFAVAQGYKSPEQYGKSIILDNINFPNLETRKYTYQQAGFNEYQSNILAKQSAFQKTPFTKKEAKRIIANYEKSHPITTIGKYIFTEAGIPQGEIKQQEDTEKFISQTPILKLVEMGSAPAVVRKVFYSAGEMFFLTTSGLFSSATGQPKLSKERIQEGGRIFGEMALWSGFSPLMKTGSYQQVEQPLATTEEYIYDYNEGVWKIKNKITGKITRVQATTEFGSLSEERQINILKKAFSQNVDETGKVLTRVYLDKQSLLKDVEKAKNFMRESGLNQNQINNLINKLFPKLQVTTPIIEQVGFVKNIPKSRFNLLNEAFVNNKIVVPQMKQVGLVSGLATLNFQNVFANTKTKQSEFNVFSQTTSQETKQKQLPSQIAIPLLKFQQAEVQQQTQPQKQVPKEAIALLSLFKQNQKLRPAQAQKFKQPSPEQPKPKKPIPIPPFSWSDVLKSKLKKEAKPQEEFSVFGRRFGKDILLSKEKTPEKAKEKLSGFLKGTLGRSGFIETKGRRLGFEEVNLGNMFTPSKKESGRIVQRARFSLSSGSERREIKQARKNKSKKFKLF
jgi:hypothetical protein